MSEINEEKLEQYNEYLCQACSSGDVYIVELLLQNGVNPNYNGNNIIWNLGEDPDMGEETEVNIIKIYNLLKDAGFNFIPEDNLGEIILSSYIPKFPKFLKLIINEYTEIFNNTDSLYAIIKSDFEFIDNIKYYCEIYFANLSNLINVEKNIHLLENEYKDRYDHLTYLFNLVEYNPVEELKYFVEQTKIDTGVKKYGVNYNKVKYNSQLAFLLSYVKDNPQIDQFVDFIEEYNTDCSEELQLSIE